MRRGEALRGRPSGARQRMAKLGVIVIDGLGSSPDSFAAQFIARTNRRLEVGGKTPRDVAWEAVRWADLVGPRQARYVEAMTEQTDLEDLPLRRFFVTAFGDAAAYAQSRRGDGGLYDQIHERVGAALSRVRAKLDARGAPLVIIGFSLGSQIASNYIWDAQHPAEGETPQHEFGTLAGLITFGSSIPLFTFGADGATPIDFPGGGLDAATREKARWLNFHGRTDVLGYPLRPINAAYAAVVSEDREIDVAGLQPDGASSHYFSNWTPAAHTRYWADPDFTDPVADFLATFL